MKSPLMILALVGLLFGANSASAWMYWHYGQSPYLAPAWYMYMPGLYLYQQIPPAVPTSTWSMMMPGLTSGVYVEQEQLPAGYRFRVYLGNRRLQDIRINIEGNALVLRSDQQQSINRPGAGSHYGFQQFGSFTQWVTLPADANASAMTLTMHNGVLNILIPKWQ